MRSSRRHFLSLFGFGAVPLLATAQQKTFVIGYLANHIPLRELEERQTPQIRIFIEDLRDLGWVEGKNIRFAWRSAEGRFDRHPRLAAELVRIPADLIVGSTEAVDAAARATRTIPIVMSGYNDPVRAGLARSLARPGGNVTGVSLTAGAEMGKQLALLKEALPSVKRVAIIARGEGFGDRVDYNAFLPARITKLAQDAGLEIFLLTFGDPKTLDAVFASAVKQGAQGIWFEATASIRDHRTHVAELAIRHRIPVMHAGVEMVPAGGLMAYGVDDLVWWRRTAYYVDRILRGEKPAEIPIEQLGKPELHLNLAAAKAIGIRFPQSILLQADRVFQ